MAWLVKDLRQVQGRGSNIILTKQARYEMRTGPDLCGRSKNLSQHKQRRQVPGRGVLATRSEKRSRRLPGPFYLSSS